MATYQETSDKEYALIARLWQRHLSDHDYRLSTEVADRIFFDLLTVLGGGSRLEIRDTIEEIKWINRNLQP